MTDAVHSEYGEAGSEVISPLACSLDGQRITVSLTAGSQLSRLHGEDRIVEHTTCNYGLSVACQDIAGRSGMTVSAIDATGEVRAVERPEHPFFLATLYQPQLRSTPDQPHPVFVGLVDAVARSRPSAAPG